eukprot:CCRYP_014566-RA/>CCRYP_014566-RA protein AED:0.69 eAED:0.69 QI:0/-1/0/1/-1/1/1/0/214
MVQAFPLKSYFLASSVCALVSHVPTSLAAPFMSLTHGSRMEKRSLNGKAVSVKNIFVGFSPHHSTSVPLILNLRTQHISPQFHVIFDNAFTTVPSLTNESERDHHFEQLFVTSRECYIDPTDITPTSKLLDDHWLSPYDLAMCNLQRQQALARSTPSIGFPPTCHPKGVPTNHLPSPDSHHPDPPEHMQPAPMVPEGAFHPDPPIHMQPAPVAP